MSGNVFGIGIMNLRFSIKRTILVALAVAVGVFLILFYYTMAGCMIDLESAKSLNNMEYRRITLFSGNSINDIQTISLNEALELGKTSHIESSHISREPLNYDSNVIDANELLDGVFEINGVKINAFGLPVITAYDGFVIFDPYIVSSAKRCFRDYRQLLHGNLISNSNTGRYEVIIDDVSAYRFSNINELNRDEAISSMHGKTVIFYAGGQKFEAQITGIYDYRSVIMRSETEDKDTWEVFEGYENFQFSSYEIENSLDYIDGFSFGCPIIINESLAKALELSSNIELTEKETLNGKVYYYVDELENVELVYNSLKGRTSCYLSNSINKAEAAIKKFTAFKNGIVLVAIAILALNLVSFINISIVIIYERKTYVGILRVVGFSKRSIMLIMTIESLMMAFLGWITGVILLLITRGILSSYLFNKLQEDGIMRIIRIPMPWLQLVVSLFIVVLLAIIISGLVSWYLLKKNSRVQLLIK